METGAMSEQDYLKVRKERPELRLPPIFGLSDLHRRLLREEIKDDKDLIRRRVAVLLNRENPFEYA
jgi:hypothetical protein